jgi:7-carboxy-7-deazaguanine synthase
MANQNILIVSETFYSIQGEGCSVGTPAVFLRLAGCNLRCNGFSYKDPDTGKHLGCDTKLVWVKGDKYTFDQIIQQWKDQHWLEKLKAGAHLVVTGGEPAIQQVALEGFLNYLDSIIQEKVYVEVETNATMIFSPALLQRFNQINTSPKLTNSGESRDKAYHADILTVLAALDKTKFKFVVAQASDIHEIVENYVKRFNVDTKNIWLMPEGGTRLAIKEKASWVVELCKEYNMHYSPRLHIDIWNEATGV